MQTVRDLETITRETFSSVQLLVFFVEERPWMNIRGGAFVAP